MLFFAKEYKRNIFKDLVKILVYNEDTYEKSLMELFQDLGYTYYYGPEVDRDYKNPLFVPDLNYLYKINKSLDCNAVDKAIETI